MFMSRSRSRSSLKMLFPLAAIFAAGHPLAAQSPCDSACMTFIAGVDSAVSTLTASLTPGAPIVLGGQEVFAHGSTVADVPVSVLLDYTDGLKAAGVQRVEFNPAVTTIGASNSVPAAEANLDAMVLHIRQLGMRLAINPEYDNGEFTVNTFQDFLNMAATTYPVLAARYKPDNFVIAHEPTTMAARMGITTTPSDWVNFINTVGPLVKQASPHTRIGAGDCVGCDEDDYFTAFAGIPTCSATNQATGCLDFMTADLYNTSFSQVTSWAQTAHASGKGMYMEETWAPSYLESNIPPGSIQSNPQGQEAFTIIGSCDTVFEPMDQQWLAAMTEFGSSIGLEAVTPFTTQAFFLYVTAPQFSGLDRSSNPTYQAEVTTAIQAGQLTATATGSTGYTADASAHGIKTVTSISNASYATLPTVFNKGCGTADNPCNPNSTVAPDMIVSAFGVDLATTTVPQSNFPTTLGGTTATLVDSLNASFNVQLASVAPSQVNYLVPSKAANGPATLTITSSDGTATTGIVFVAPVNPGIYTASANGQGTASGIAVCTGTCTGYKNSLGNSQFWEYTFTPGCTAEPCTVPISWGANDSLVIELYGTGIRNRAALSDISASIGRTSLSVEFAGAQGADIGLDQVNVAIPQSLRGAGQVQLVLTAQDTVNNITVTSNAVALDFQ
jgi:uncharacterized protein (TIGR03437 family)